MAQTDMSLIYIVQLGCCCFKYW